MQISERAKNLAHRMWNDDSSAEQDLEIFQQALDAERNDALDESLDVIGDCLEVDTAIVRIRALKRGDKT